MLEVHGALGDDGNHDNNHDHMNHVHVGVNVVEEADKVSYYDTYVPNLHKEHSVYFSPFLFQFQRMFYDINDYRCPQIYFNRIRIIK